MSVTGYLWLVAVACAVGGAPGGGGAPSGGVPLVEGEVVFDGEVRAFAGARAYVRLEDVTRADGPAGVVAEQVLEVSAAGGRVVPLSFALTGVVADARASYSVRVHVDVDGDGRVSPGDYVTMQSYPAVTRGHPSRVTVRVHLVE